MAPMHALTVIDHDTVMSQQMLSPRFNGGLGVFHPNPFQFLDVWFRLYPIQVFVQSIHQELAKLLTVVLVAVVKLRGKGANSLFEQAGRQNRVLSAPYFP